MAYRLLLAELWYPISWAFWNPISWCGDEGSTGDMGCEDIQQYRISYRYTYPTYLPSALSDNISRLITRWQMLGRNIWVKWWVEQSIQANLINYMTCLNWIIFIIMSALCIQYCKTGKFRVHENFTIFAKIGGFAKISCRENVETPLSTDSRNITSGMMQNYLGNSRGHGKFWLK